MKTSLWAIAATALLMLAAGAAEPAVAVIKPDGTAEPANLVVQRIPDYGWTFLSFSFTPDVPEDAAYTTVYGVKVGVPITGGPAPVNGVDAAIFYAGTDEVNGLQASLISTGGKWVTGIQFSLVNFSISVAGLQLGIVNVAEEEAFQIGLLNFIKGGSVYCLPIINVYFK